MHYLHGVDKYTGKIVPEDDNNKYYKVFCLSQRTHLNTLRSPFSNSNCILTFKEMINWTKKNTAQIEK